MILPDYQGIGLGTSFLNLIAEYYTKQNYDFSIITSAKNLINALRKNKNWCMYGYDKSKNSKTGTIDNHRKVRSECYTGRFMYKKGGDI